MKTLILLLALLAPVIALAEDDSYDEGVRSDQAYQQEREQILRDARENSNRYQQQLNEIGQASRDRVRQYQQNDMENDLRRIRENQRRSY